MEELSFVDVDIMLRHVGDFDRFQYLLIGLFSLINILSGFHYFGQTFISVTPEYKCKPSPYDDVNKTTYLACYKTIQEGATTKKVACNSGWDYNTSYGYISIVQEMDWVCNDSWPPVVAHSFFYVGAVLGSFALGILADRIGRLRVLIIANMIVIVGNMATAMSTHPIAYIISRFLAGAATDTNFVMMYIIVMEYIRPKMRTAGLNLCIGVFYCISCVVVPWLAVGLRTWKWFLVAISLPHLSVLSFAILVPESAQWLLSKGRTDEAIACFERIARFNRRTVDPKVLAELRKYANEHIKTVRNENLIGLISTPRLRKKMLILMFKSMVMSLGYDTIARNVNGFGFSPFTIFSICSITILPACVVILFLQDRWGRKALASGALFISGLFSAIGGVILVINQYTSPILIIAISIICRFSINVAYNSGAQYAVELIPTVVRGQGVSAIHVIGYIANFCSPSILYMGEMWKPSPDLLLAVLLIFGAFACLFLPETLNKTLPVTLEDGENFGEDERFYEFYCCGGRGDDSVEILNPGIYKIKYIN
ncbi:hypothetical protein PPYR_09843 [Photinus pyralis]|uniref:Major facilitator superfamily (MFS) profile domain-containing protein n=1 Tax=Photinus pyralis TaxID=7054 RepID=A0A1Y1JWP7_PHOPY|nr:organic cation transporter protein-like [Photinus pyralis]XP_031348662.1 organic cation transporter protein-like [Photinus pyralis]KAB0795782.1 hypothetical protein PPYR_09843 [Photinus pyralis]